MLLLDLDCVKTALQYAAGEGNEDVARMLMEKGEDVNERDSKGRTALHYASDGVYANINVVKLLIERGADIFAVDGANMTGLDYAVLGVDDNIKVLLFSTMMERLVKEKGIEASKEFRDKYFNLIDFPVNEKDVFGRTPLHRAVLLYRHHDNYTDQQFHTDIFESYDNPYTMSVHNYYQECYLSDLQKVLSTPGIDVNIQNMDGNTALHLAIIQHGEFCLQEDRDRYIYYSASNCYIEELLKRKDINVNISNNQGHTPYYYALKFSNYTAIKLFSELDIKLTIADIKDIKNEKIYTKWDKNYNNKVISSLFMHLNDRTFGLLQTDAKKESWKKLLSDISSVCLSFNDCQKEVIIEKLLTAIEQKQVLVEPPREVRGLKTEILDKTFSGILDKIGSLNRDLYSLVRSFDLTVFAQNNGNISVGHELV